MRQLNEGMKSLSVHERMQKGNKSHSASTNSLQSVVQSETTELHSNMQLDGLIGVSVSVPDVRSFSRMTQRRASPLNRASILPLPSSSTKSNPQSQGHENNYNHLVPANLSPHMRKVEAIGCGWNAMGLENAKCQRWDSAILCWEHALEIRLQIFGKYHPDVANTLNNLGIVWGKMQQYDRARESLNQALEIRTRIHACRGSANSIKNNNPHHTDIAATLYNIGNISHKMKDYDVALDSFNRAMKTHVILNDDLSAARTCAALGRLHLEKGDIDKALEAYLDALAFYSKAKYRKGDDEYDALIGDIDQAQQLLNKSRA